MTQTSGAGSVLIEAATPVLYRANAFRVTALPVDATSRDLSRQQQRAAILERFGENSHGALGPLKLIPAPSSDDIRDAMQRLRDPERRLIEELFWFWPMELGQSINDEGLQALNSGEPATAARIWAMRARTPKDAGVAIHNLAVLAHATALDGEYNVARGEVSHEMLEERDRNWRAALDRWVTFGAHAEFWQRVVERIKESDDPRLTNSAVNQLRSALPKAIVSITAQLATKAAETGNRRETTRLLELLRQSGFERPVVDDALELVIQPIRERIALLCDSATRDASESAGAGASIARRLLEQALPVIAILDRLLPQGNAIREGAHDQVATSAENSLAVYGRKTNDWKAVQEVHDYAGRIAASASARQRLEKNSGIIKDNIIYGTCWFCKKTPPDDGEAVMVPMHGNVTRTPRLLGIAGTDVRWESIAVSVPRCRACALAHRRVVRLRSVGLTIGSLVGIASCTNLVNQSNDNSGVGLVVAVAGAGVGALTGWLAGHSRMPPETAPLSTKDRFPAVQEKFGKGWSVGKQPQGVK